VAAVLRDLDLPFPKQRGFPLTLSKVHLLLVVAALVVLGTGGAAAEDTCSATITIRDHRFEPAELHVPAGKRIALTVVNADPLSEEFDSSALKVEKVIAGKSQGVVHISPLSPGRYDFIGEYHEETAKGQVIAE
jgi:plastocyanin